MMVGKKMIAVAKRDLEFSCIEKWKKGERYAMVYDAIGGIIALESDGGYVGHWSTAAFSEIHNNFDIISN